MQRTFMCYRMLYECGAGTNTRHMRMESNNYFGEFHQVHIERLRAAIELTSQPELPSTWQWEQRDGGGGRTAGTSKRQQKSSGNARRYVNNVHMK